VTYLNMLKFMKVLLFWDVTPCRCCSSSWRFEGTSQEWPCKLKHYFISKGMEPVAERYRVMSRKGWILNQTGVATLFLVLYCDGTFLRPETGVLLCNVAPVSTLCTVFAAMCYTSIIRCREGVMWRV
jgi:hypothetical protein